MKHCCASRCLLGITLLEVVGAIALLSTLLVGGLIAYDRLARQVRHGHSAIQVAETVDSMLSEWYSEPNAIPLHGQGDVPGDNQFYWETRVVNTRLEREWGLRIVRLSVRSKMASRMSDPILSIDIVAAAEMPELPNANDTGIQGN